MRPAIRRGGRPASSENHPQIPRKNPSQGPAAFRRWLFSILLLALAFELVARPLAGILFPDAPLPESFLKEILALCLSMAGV